MATTDGQVVRRLGKSGVGANTLIRTQELTDGKVVLPTVNLGPRL